MPRLPRLLELCGEAVIDGCGLVAAEEGGVVALLALAA